MEITDPPKPSIGNVLGLIAVFAITAILSFYYAFIVTLELMNEVQDKSNLITIDKGAYYLYGVGFTALVFVIGLIYTKILSRDLSDTLHRLFTRLIILGLVLTFALPQIVHFTVSNHLEGQGYQICQEKSHRWLHVVTIVYTNYLPCGEK